ncbi:glycosyltransferase family 4 protein [Candidatus Reidiella endopervernicosa]|uniref:Glycosyltransferase family 4 protein n=1 Tax=Candidatus Reidiella endopervernicosa TaxID=2738883 RepID=A0A6N0I0Y5_9GAMM|nr:glycosyltransferase family 4 protein [Candidatus Reidiella endopervernicosa]
MGGKESIRILVLSKYARNGASSRYRTYQYLPFFEQLDIEVKVMPLFDESYIDQLYNSGKVSRVEYFRAFLRRISSLVTVYHYDVVLIEYEVFPYFPALFERLLSWTGIKYLVDYDDALFHQYDMHPSWLVRRLLGNKIATVMKLSEVVIAGNGYLMDYAKLAGSKRVEVIPTVVDLDNYPLTVNNKRHNSKFTIGWIGSPTTARYLQLICPALREFCEASGSHVRIVGSGEIELPGVDIEIVEWSEEDEIEMLHTFDVGIMPLPNEYWARGKCGFKLIQYMACGLPVIASPVGVNSDIVEHGVNGFLAKTTEEWVAALNALLSDSLLRQNMGEAGRSKVERQYSLQVTAPHLAGILSSVA